ncbi:MAG: hypothetical protein H8E30_12585 [Alphaproteobacteria bacterium]|nr:hypothetical protein [Alphaproteobacteria bacterium]MBL6935434.1 hypothetical protein [Alphaproteobacteria bacterium]
MQAAIWTGLGLATGRGAFREVKTPAGETPGETTDNVVSAAACEFKSTIPPLAATPATAKTGIRTPDLRCVLDCLDRLDRDRCNTDGFMVWTPGLSETPKNCEYVAFAIPQGCQNWAFHSSNRRSRFCEDGALAVVLQKSLSALCGGTEERHTWLLRRREKSHEPETAPLGKDAAAKIPKYTG